MAAFCGLVIGISIYRHNQNDRCPRLILGYNCKKWTGEPCDHSRLAALNAETSMEKARLKNQKNGNFWKGPNQL